MPPTPVNSTNPRGIAGSGDMIWDGPVLPCLQLCKGTKVSAVIFALGKMVCEMQTKLDMSTLDLKCLAEDCNCPTTAKTLLKVLQVLINKVCAMAVQLSTLAGASSGGGGTTTPGDDNETPIPWNDDPVDLPQALRYDHETTGITITQLPVPEYVMLLAKNIVDREATFNAQGTELTELGTGLDNLKIQVENIDEVTVTPAYLSEENTELPIGAAYLLLEDAFNTLKEKTGEGTEAATSQPAGLSVAKRLNGEGTMGAIEGWVQSPQNLAHAVNNLWLAYADTRAAVVSIKENYLAPDESQIIADYILTFAANRQTATFKLKGAASIPYGWVATTEASTLTLMSAGEQSYVYQIPDAVAFMANDGVTLNLQANNINGTLDMTGTLVLRLKTTDGSLTAQRSVMKQHIAPCDKTAVSGLQTANVSHTGFTIIWQAPAVETGKPQPTTYRVTVSHNNGSVVEQDRDVQGSALTQTFDGLLADTSYVATVVASFPCGDADPVSVSIKTNVAPIT